MFITNLNNKQTLFLRIIFLSFFLFLVVSCEKYNAIKQFEDYIKDKELESVQLYFIFPNKNYSLMVPQLYPQSQFYINIINKLQESVEQNLRVTLKIEEIFFWYYLRDIKKIMREKVPCDAFYF